MHPGSRGHASAGPPQPGDSSSPLKLHAYSGPRAALSGMPRKGGISIGAASSGRLTWMHGSGAQWPGLPLRQTYPGRLAASMLVVLERARGRTLGHLLPPHLPLPGLPLPRTAACKRARGAGAREGRTLGQQLPHGNHATWPPSRPPPAHTASHSQRPLLKAHACQYLCTRAVCQ